MICLGLVSASPALALDSELYARLLGQYTHAVSDVAGTRVDYRGLGVSADWTRLVEGLHSFEPDELAGREEKLAFWINAYNVLAIELVTRNYPVESIKDLGWLVFPVWNRRGLSIGGRAYSLSEIEHDIVRPMGEPRIHAAIVCASTSCPSLAREPYEASRLSEQLDAAMRAFVADSRKGFRLDRATGVVHLSKVFEWFESDFSSHGGVISFLLPYLPPDARAYLEQREGEVRKRYLEYDWSLNDTARSGRGARPGAARRAGFGQARLISP